MEVFKGAEFKTEFSEICSPDCAHILYRSSNKTDLESGFPYQSISLGV